MVAINLPVTVKVGSRSVLASGIVCSYGNEDVEISVGSLRYLITFETDEGKKLDVVPELLGDNGMKIRLINFDNPLGSSYWANVGDVNASPLDWICTFIRLARP